MMKAIELNSVPHDEAKKLVSTGAPVYLFVNPVEFHGPHLPLYNDFHLSLAATEDLHSRLQVRHPEWPLLIGTPLHMGVDPVPGFGSMPFKYPAVKKAVILACKGLEALGAKRVILMTFHGSPMHAMAIQAGVDYLVNRGIPAVAPFNILLNEMLTYKPGRFDKALSPIQDPEVRRSISANLYKDFHGGFFETSIVLHYRPDTVAPIYKTLPACPEIKPHFVFSIIARLMGLIGLKKLEAELRFASFGLGWLKLKPLPGYTGWPHLANPETGAIFVEDLMTRYVACVEEVFEQKSNSPEPIMQWMRPLSLGGRIASH